MRINEAQPNQTTQKNTGTVFPEPYIHQRPQQSSEPYPIFKCSFKLTQLTNSQLLPDTCGCICFFCASRRSGSGNVHGSKLSLSREARTCQRRTELLLGFFWCAEYGAQYVLNTLGVRAQVYGLSVHTVLYT